MIISGHGQPAGGLDDQALDACIDKDGNVYVTGEFRGTVDFDPTTKVDEHVTSGNFPDAFITKLASDGSYLWTRTIGGSGTDTGRGIAVASDGTIAIVGEFGGSADFDPGAATDIRAAAGQQDAFLVQLDPQGTYIGTIVLGSTRDDAGKDVTFDADDNLVVVGAFGKEFDFDPGPGTDRPVHAAYYDAFVTKFSFEGNYAWTYAFGGDDNDQALCVATDANGNVYIGGSFAGTVDFEGLGGNGDTHTAGGIQDAFLMCLGGDGSYGWTYTAGGPETHYTKYDTCTAVAVGKNSVSMAGSFAGTVDFGNGDPLTARGGRDAFLVTLATDGGVLDVRSVGGADDDDGKALGLLSTGDLVLTGTFQGSADLDPTGDEQFVVGTGGLDVFVTQLRLQPGNTVRGGVWHDVDLDLKWGPAEQGLGGWSVYLDDNGDGEPGQGEAVMATSGDGSFVFNDVPDGVHTVAVGPRPGWRQNAPAKLVYTFSVAGGDIESGLAFGFHAAANSPPIPQADTYAVSGKNGLAKAAPGVMANDSDPDGDPLTVSVKALPAKGSLTLSPDGSFTYTPTAQGEGIDTFEYGVSDGTDTRNAVVTLVITTTESYDYGDAQGTGLPTTLSDNGARHRIVSGIHLGAAVDAENDGLANSEASGDDATGIDDEDGVYFLSELVQGQTALIRLDASVDGFLDAWIDFNGDGDWEDEDEQVWASKLLNAGSQTLSLSIPGSASVGVAMARFRFSLQGGLSYAGTAADGEVEDYAVAIQQLSVLLRAGWNLFSMGTPVQLPDKRALPGSLWRWDPDGQQFVPLGPDDGMSSTAGYWLYVEEETLLQLDPF